LCNSKLSYPSKKLISNKSLEVNYEFIAWFHTFYKVNTQRSPSVENKTFFIRKALRRVITSSNKLVDKCIAVVDPSINDVMVCIDFENTHLSGEFWDLKRTCIQYTMVTQKIAAAKKQKQNKEFTKGVRDFYKLILKAGDMGSHINLEYNHLIIYPKEEKMVKLANAVTKAVDTCVELSTKTAIALQKIFGNLDVETDNEKLTKSLKDQQKCLEGAAKLSKLKLQRLKTSVFSEEKSSPMATWLKLLEARIRAEVTLQAHSNILQ